MMWMRHTTVMVGVALATAGLATVGLGGAPVQAQTVQTCWGQNRVEVVPAGGTLSCSATQALPRDNRNTGQSSNPQFTATALISSDGVTVTVSASGAPEGWTLYVISQRGISTGVKEGEASAIFSGGAATVSLPLQCGQVDVNTLPPGFSGERGVWRIAGPYITNSTDCTSQPPTTPPTTPPITTPTTTPTTATTPTTPTAPTTPPTGPTSTPSTPSTVPSSVQQSTVSSLPSTGGGGQGAYNVALAAVAVGALLVVVAARRVNRSG